MKQVEAGLIGDGPRLVQEIEKEKRDRCSMDSTLSVLEKKEELLMAQVDQMKKEHDASIIQRTTLFAGLTN